MRTWADTQKKTCAAEQKRPEVAEARRIWIAERQPFMVNLLTRIGFIDETSIKTNMAKTTGWAPRGQRLVDHTPFGSWRPRLSSPPCAMTASMPLG